MVACDFPIYRYDEIRRLLTSTFIRFQLLSTSNCTVLMQGKLNGTVFSGDSIQTSFGNTLRQLAYIHYIADKQGIPQDKIWPNVAGDDAIICIDRAYTARLKTGMELYFNKPREYGSPVIYRGLGQALKFLYHNNEVQVHLSK